MNDQVPIEVTEAAGGWFDLLSQADTSLRRREEFVDWLDRSPVHVAEFLRVSALYAELSSSMVDFPDWAEALLSAEGGSVVEVARLQGTVLPMQWEEETVKLSSPRTTRPRTWFAVAATLIVVVSAVFWSTMFEDSSRLITAVGEQRVVILDDGSRLQLNTNSEVSVRFREDLRELALVKGEILINVHKDLGRPFIVSTDTAIVQATGTAFNVYYVENTTEVTVLEGQVLVGWSPASLKSRSVSQASARSLELDAGQMTVVAENKPASKSTVTDISRATAWTERRLFFEDETVVTVAGEFNRYNRSQILVDDPALAKRRISGVFDVNEPDAFIALISGLEAVEIQLTQDGNRSLRYKVDH